MQSSSPTRLPQPPPLRAERAHPRAAADFDVRIELGRHSVLCRARDFSMTGLFVEEAPALPPEFPVRIPMPGVDLEVTAICRVKRREGSGAALSFHEIDWDDLLLLARRLAPRL
jgi:hypothetical protein